MDGRSTLMIRSLIPLSSENNLFIAPDRAQIGCFTPLIFLTFISPATNNNRISVEILRYMKRSAYHEWVTLFVEKDMVSRAIIILLHILDAILLDQFPFKNLYH